MSEPILVLIRLQEIIDVLPADQQLRAIAWIEAAMEESADETDRGILANLLTGAMDIVSCSEEEGPRFRLTPAGRDHVLELFHQSPEMRALYERLSGQPFTDPPKGAQ